MPDIDIDYFLSTCSKSDIQEIIQVLVENGWLKPSATDESPRGYDEQVYEDSLKKLHGKWNRLSKEEENQILKIAKRF